MSTEDSIESANCLNSQGTNSLVCKFKFSCICIDRNGYKQSNFHSDLILMMISSISYANLSGDL